MTNAGASKAVALSAAATVSLVSLSHMLPDNMGGKGELPSMREGVAAGVVFTTLAAGVDPAPTLVGWFAISIMTSAIIWYGIPILDKNFTHVEPKKGNK